MDDGLKQACQVIEAKLRKLAAKGGASHEATLSLAVANDGGTSSVYVSAPGGVWPMHDHNTLYEAFQEAEGNLK